MIDRWPTFLAAYENLCDSFGKRLNETQAKRWYAKLGSYEMHTVVAAIELLEETCATFPTLPKLLDTIRSTSKGGEERCAACNGSRVVYVRKLDGRKQLPGELWHGKGPAECYCVQRGAPLNHDPALPGNERCVCKGRGWESFKAGEALPDGRRVLGHTLSGTVMVHCPCTPSDEQRGVHREIFNTHDDVDRLSDLWAVD